MGATSGRSGARDARWLVFVHHLRPKPHYVRVRIGRRLRALGAVAIKNSVYALPATPEMRRGAAAVAREIERDGGLAVVCEARFVAGLTDESAEDLFREAHDREYAGVADQARQLATALSGAHRPASGGSARAVTGEARRRGIAARLAQLQRRFREIVSRDVFGARSRESAAGVLSLVEDRLQGVEVPGRPRVVDPPRAATWVTRRGVMVDRIASAWLIRRFIDPRGRFKFVGSRGYRPSRGEIRFDMAGAEFTHAGARCTFEVLVDGFRLHEAALRPIGEIVHDLDLGDGRYGRPETAGIGRMIVGLAILTHDDEARIERGAAIFDHLFESFGRQRR